MLVLNRKVSQFEGDPQATITITSPSGEQVTIEMVRCSHGHGRIGIRVPSLAWGILRGDAINREPRHRDGALDIPEENP